MASTGACADEVKARSKQMPSSTRGQDNLAAQALLDFLKSDLARQAIHALGYNH